KKLLIVVSVIALLCMGFFALNLLPELQMKANQVITWVRGAIHPSGALPMADVADAKSTEQKSFWLPDLMSEQIDSGDPVEAVQAKRINTTFPASVVLPSPTFNPRRDYQDWNNCGPATLVLGLRYWGWKGDQFTISEVIRPKRQDKNVDIEELAQYVNQNTDDYQAELRVGGDLNTLEALIAGGYPVIIEESFTIEKPAWPGDDLWAGHYLLLTGYDEQKKLFTAQDSYYGPDRLLAYSDVADAWQAFNHVYLIAFPKSDLQKVQMLLGEDWQNDANLKRTSAALQSQLQSEPGNMFAWFNLGTTLTLQHDYTSAALAFDKARALGLPQRILRYQFGPLVAAYQTGDVNDLTQLADYALKITPDSEEALLWKGWSYELAGDHLSAITLFDKALEANPGYLEAEKALSIVRP
ncbi:MAG: C39 family peptidase, partial [Ignavibacteria bacterium]|nr:C39 family peptidase [Ignavibacteria bacterium]